MEPNYILQPNRVSVDGSPAPQSYFIFGISCLMDKFGTCILSSGPFVFEQHTNIIYRSFILGFNT